MKRVLLVFAVVFFASIVGAYAAPSDTDKGDVQSYTPVVPSSGAIAEWVADFSKSYKETGVYQAVAEVFEDGRTPKEIVTESLNLKINPQNLVAALFCAGAKHEDIRLATEEVGISEIVLVSGFKVAKRVCDTVDTDAQAYTPVSRGPSFSGPAAGNVSGRTYGSASDFSE